MENQTPRYFIYDRKEILILVLLGVMVAAFAFTLGVHLGKRSTQLQMTSATTPGTAAPAHGIEAEAEVPPEHQEIREMSKHADEVADDSLKQSLHEEVTRTGIRLEKSVPMELPREAKSKNAGATTLTETEAKAPAHSHAEAPVKSAPAPGAAAYALQVGSYPDLDQAQSRIHVLEEGGRKPFLKEVQVKGLGKRYRVFLGGYTSQSEAEHAGAQLITEKIIESFVVSKLSETTE